ncbi:MAG: stage II sporulation protein E [Spirochaetaceae bacterium]|jgi:hypothetical protein|nr:stage II sporulation protein E [Spirochaetaceae bacterium]
MMYAENRNFSPSDMRKNIFIEVDYFLERKAGQSADGSVFLSKKNAAGSRIVAALSNGITGGVKADIMANLTAAMLIEFVLKDIPPLYAAELIISNLPACCKRDLNRAAFTLVDIRHDLTVHFIEYDSPPVVIVRENRLIEPEKIKIPIERKSKKTVLRDEALFYSTYAARPDDRIVFFSNGVTGAREYALTGIESRPLISARELAQSVVGAARFLDSSKIRGGMSCGVVYFRKPRDLLVITGPPFHRKDDREMARVFEQFAGQKVILGGTTAKIIARELGKTIREPLDFSESPAISLMDGAGLVCEGILTLEAAAAGLAGSSAVGQNPYPSDSFSLAVSRFTGYLLNSDRVTFIVGTKINEAHHEPSMPVEIESRRSVIKRVSALLEEKYMKQTIIRYM